MSNELHRAWPLSEGLVLVVCLEAPKLYAVRYRSVRPRSLQMRRRSVRSYMYPKYPLLFRRTRFLRQYSSLATGKPLGTARSVFRSIRLKAFISFEA